MALLTMPSDYTIGTISLENGSDAFTGTDTAWELVGLAEGDLLIDIEGATEYWALIAEITSNTTGRLTRPWAGPTLSGVEYRMRFTSDGVRSTAQAAMLRQQLGNGNLQAVAGLSGSANQVPMFTGPGAMTLVPKTDLISGAAYDVQVADLAARAAYDGQDEGFAVLVANTGDGRAAIYSKNSDTSGDWSDPAYVTGADYDLSIGAVTEVPFGDTPNVTLTPTPGGGALDFELEGSATFSVGTTTTGDPGTAASVELTPVAGGYQIDFTIPAGEGFYAEGDYDAGTTYAKGDVVQHQGSSWIALQATTGNVPPTLPTTSNAYWQLLARAGNDGEGTVTSLAGGTGIDIDSTDPTIPVVAAIIASQAEAEAGTEAEKLMTPERVAQAIKTLSPSLAGMHNCIINPIFEINQRSVAGSVTLAAGEYGHDRWKAGAAGCTYTFATSNGVTTITISSGSLQQAIEASVFAGRPGGYVLSWTGTAQGRIDGGAYGDTGTVIAAIDGSANVTVEFGAGTVTAVQLERGDVPTPLGRRHPQQELALCQRYFIASTQSILARNQNGYGEAAVLYPTTMRVTPSLSGTLNSSGATNTAIVSRETGFSVLAEFGAGSASRYGYSDWSADAEL